MSGPNSASKFTNHRRKEITVCSGLKKSEKTTEPDCLVSSFAAHIAAIASGPHDGPRFVDRFGRAATDARELSRDDDNRLHGHPRLEPGSRLTPATSTTTSGALTMSALPSFFQKRPLATPLQPFIPGTPTPSASTPRTPPAKHLPKSQLTAFASRTTRARPPPPPS